MRVEPEAARVSFGAFTFDLTSLELTRGGRALRLQPQPARLLALLVQRPGALITRDELQAELWPQDTYVDFEQGLNFCIRQVRIALGDTAGTPRFVETLPRRGYRFIAPVGYSASLSPARPSADARDGSHSSPVTPASPVMPAEEMPPSAFAKNASTAAVPTAPVRGGTNRTSASTWLFAAAGSLAVGAVVLFSLWRADAPANASRSPVVSLAVPPPAGWHYTFQSRPIVSPDGRNLITRADGDGRSALWLTDLRHNTSRALEGTMGATYPFWSPDSSSIAFFADGTLKRLEVASGAVRSICAVANARGGAWSTSGDLLFAADGEGLFRVSQTSGAVTQIIALDDAIGAEEYHGPAFLPDGERFLYFAQTNNPETTGVYLGSLSDGRIGERRVKTPSSAVFAPPDRLFFLHHASDRLPITRAWRSALVDGRTLVVQRFDPETATVHGEPTVVANGRFESANVSVSPEGVLAYRTSEPPPATALTWMDRAGRALATVGGPSFAPHPEISQDGQRIVFNRLDKSNGTPELWLHHVLHGTEQRVTFSPAIDALPVWSPDGTQVAFASDRSGPSDLYVKDLDGARPERLLARSSRSIFPTSWSPDGRSIVVQHNKAGGIELAAVDTQTGRITSLVQEPAAVSQGRLSPDGKWLAYRATDRSGASEIRVQPHPPTGAMWVASRDGDRDPRWRGDGRELFMVSADWSKLRSVAVEYSSGRPVFSHPRTLFGIAVWPGPPTPRNHYAVSRDGQRFLVDTVVSRSAPPPLHVLTDWRSLTSTEPGK